MISLTLTNLPKWENNLSSKKLLRANVVCYISKLVALSTEGSMKGELPYMATKQKNVCSFNCSSQYLSAAANICQIKRHFSTLANISSHEVNIFLTRAKFILCGQYLSQVDKL
jgi:hypothetical protein